MKMNRHLMIWGYFILALLPALFVCCNKTPAPTTPERDIPWKVFNKSNCSIVSNKINSIFIDGSGAKWFCTDKGVSRLSAGTWANQTTTLEYITPFGRRKAVNAITLGKDGSIWYGLDGGGIKRQLTSGSQVWKEYHSPDLTSEVIFALRTDYAGEIWAGTSSGVSRCRPAPDFQSNDKWFQYNSENSLVPDEPIQSIGVNPHDGTVWFGTYSMGVISFDSFLDWNMFAPTDMPLPILSMAYTFGVNAWFGTYGDWAYLYNSGTSEWKQFADSVDGGGLPNFIVNAVASDNNGSIWFGTYGGLTKYNGSKWKTWEVSSSDLPSDTVTALGVDKLGNIWIGTVNGVAEFNENGIIK